MDITRQENREHQYHADRTGCYIWHEYLLRKRNIHQLGSICLFACRCCAVYVNVRFSFGCPPECAFDRDTLGTVVARTVDERSDAGHLLCYPEEEIYDSNEDFFYECNNGR